MPGTAPFVRLSRFQNFAYQGLIANGVFDTQPRGLQVAFESREAVYTHPLAFASGQSCAYVNQMIVQDL